MYHKYWNCQAGRVKANPAPLPGPARLRLAAGRGPSLVVRDGAVVEAPAIVRADDPVPVDARTRHRRPTGGIEVSVVQDPEVGAAGHRPVLEEVENERVVDVSLHRSVGGRDAVHLRLDLGPQGVGTRGDVRP